MDRIPSSKGTPPYNLETILQSEPLHSVYAPEDDETEVIEPELTDETRVGDTEWKTLKKYNLKGDYHKTAWFKNLKPIELKLLQKLREAQRKQGDMKELNPEAKLRRRRPPGSIISKVRFFSWQGGNTEDEPQVEVSYIEYDARLIPEQMGICEIEKVALKQKLFVRHYRQWGGKYGQPSELLTRYANQLDVRSCDGGGGFMGCRNSHSDISTKYTVEFNRGSNNETKHGHQQTFLKSTEIGLYRERLFHSLDQRNKYADKDKQGSNGLMEGKEKDQIQTANTGVVYTWDNWQVCYGTWYPRMAPDGPQR